MVQLVGKSCLVSWCSVPHFLVIFATLLYLDFHMSKSYAVFSFTRVASATAALLRV